MKNERVFYILEHVNLGHDLPPAPQLCSDNEYSEFGRSQELWLTYLFGMYVPAIMIGYDERKVTIGHFK